MWTPNCGYERGVLGPENGIVKLTTMFYLVQSGINTWNLVTGCVSLMPFSRNIKHAPYRFVQSKQLIWITGIPGLVYNLLLLNAHERVTESRFLYSYYWSVRWGWTMEALHALTYIYRPSQRFRHQALFRNCCALTHWNFEIWTNLYIRDVIDWLLGPLLLTWFNFDPSMDK